MQDAHYEMHGIVIGQEVMADLFLSMPPADSIESEVQKGSVCKVMEKEM